MAVPMVLARKHAAPQIALCLVLAGALLLPCVAQAQTLGDVEQRLDRLEKAVRQVQNKPADREPRPSKSRDDVYLQLDRRLGAVERALSSIVSAQERDHRELATALEQLRRIKGDVEARLDAVERHPAAPTPVSQPTAAIANSGATPPNADDRFKQAMGYASQQDWTQAELAFDTFVTTYPADMRVPEARYQLGRAFEGQGKHAQAAQIFLDLYEKNPDAPFIIENLFALGQALAALGPENMQQACDVYGEIEAAHGADLSAEQRSRLLDRRLTLKCSN
jgi:TolA-binding protein